MRADNDNAPRLFGRREAATYLGIGESTFSLWVSTHKMPQPIPGTRKWDRRAIDAKLDAISGIDIPAELNMDDEFARWEKDHDARKAEGPGAGKKATRKR